MDPKRDMDERLNVDMDPEDALRILLRSINDPDLPPLGEPLDENGDE